MSGRSPAIRRAQAERADIITEYRAEYAAAVEWVALKIWISMRTHDGDPRWEWTLNQFGDRVEVLT